MKKELLYIHESYEIGQKLLHLHKAVVTVESHQNAMCIIPSSHTVLISFLISHRD